MSVVSPWRAYKSFRMYQSGLGAKAIGGYLFRASSTGFALGQAASWAAIKYVDYAAGPSKTNYIKQWQYVDPSDPTKGTEQVLTPVQSGGHLRHLGLRTMDEASDALAVALTDIGKWKKVSDLKKAPSILAEFYQQAGVTPMLGFTQPDMWYGALDQMIGEKERTKKKTITVWIDNPDHVPGRNPPRIPVKRQIDVRSTKGWVVLGAKVASWIL